MANPTYGERYQQILDASARLDMKKIRDTTTEGYPLLIIVEATTLSEKVKEYDFLNEILAKSDTLYFVMPDKSADLGTVLSLKFKAKNPGKEGDIVDLIQETIRENAEGKGKPLEIVYTMATPTGNVATQDMPEEIEQPPLAYLVISRAGNKVYEKVMGEIERRKIPFWMFQYDLEGVLSRMNWK